MNDDTLVESPAEVQSFLAPASVQRGQEFLEEAQAAIAAGDDGKVEEIREAVMSDPSLGPAVKEQMKSSPADREENNSELKDAQFRLVQIAGEIKDLYIQLIRKAVSTRESNRGGTHDSIGDRDADLKRIVGATTVLLESEKAEDLDAVVGVLNVDDNVDFITRRIKGLVGYFGGSMPEQLRPQARILDEIRAVNESLKTANADWQKKRNQSK